MNRLPSYTARASLAPAGLGLLDSSASLDPVVGDWQSRGGLASASTLDALDAFVKGLRADGTFNKMARLNLMLGSTLSSCLLPQIVGGGGSSDVAMNFVSGDYAEATGLTGNGASKYLDLGASLGTILASSPPATGGMGFYLRSNLTTTSTRYIMGSQDGVNGYEALRYTSTPSHLGMWGGTSGTSAINTNPGAGAYHVDRSADTNLALYKNGVSAATRVTSISPGSNGLNVFAFCRNSSGAPNGYSDATLAGYWITRSLTATEALSFYGRIQALQMALGRSV